MTASAMQSMRALRTFLREGGDPNALLHAQDEEVKNTLATKLQLAEATLQQAIYAPVQQREEMQDLSARALEDLTTEARSLSQQITHLRSYNTQLMTDMTLLTEQLHNLCEHQQRQQALMSELQAAVSAAKRSFVQDVVHDCGTVLSHGVSQTHLPLERMHLYCHQRRV